MQKKGVSIDENFAAYVDGVTGLWIPPASGTEVTGWISPNLMDLRVAEACRILGIDDHDAERAKGLSYPVTDELYKKLREGSDPDFGSPGFQQTLNDRGWKYKEPDALDHKRLVKEFLALSQTSATDLADQVRKFVLEWGLLWRSPRLAA